MSPYRVFVKYKSSERRTILAAMLSTDKTTGRKYIHVIEKYGYLESVDESARELAHKQTSSLNCQHLATYEMVLSDDGKKYAVRMRIGNDSWYMLNGLEFKQSDCLAKAMQDYCNRQNLDIIQVL